MRIRSVNQSQGGGDNITQKFFNRELSREEKLALMEEHKDKYELNKVLKIKGVAKNHFDISDKEEGTTN